MANTPDQELLSFKEIDARHRLPKGAAFRAFKRLGGQLREGEHYRCLDARTQGVEIESLKREGRLYGSTVNAVLLTPAGYRLLKERLDK